MYKIISDYFNRLLVGLLLFRVLCDSPVQLVYSL